MLQKEFGLYDYLKLYTTDRGGDRFLVTEEDSLSVRECCRICEIMMEEQRMLGIRSGDTVWMPAETKTSAKWILRFLALQCMGAVTVLAEPGEMPEENRFPSVRWILQGEKLHPRFLVTTADMEERAWEEETRVDSRNASILLFTSGSSGEKKLVRLSQYNFIQNSLDTRERGGYISEDLNLLMVPVHHVFGIALIITAIVLQHAIFVPKRRKPEHTAACIRKYHITRMNGVPSMYFALAEQAAKEPMPSLRCGLIGGGPCTPEQFCETEDTLGMKLIPVYGMSECIGISCGDYRETLKRRSVGVGRPYSKNQVKLDMDGEILVKSPAQFLGYENTEISETVDAEGYVHTGDLGYFDEEGVLCLSGRKKDLIIRGGENISPLKIENALLEFPEVRLAAVIRVEDALWGEVPKAFLVLRNSWQKESEIASIKTRIREFLVCRLNSYEVPKYISILTEMPLTSTGKIDKQKLKNCVVL